ncbi:hypothetical protein [Clostridium sp. HBUAS56010]|uniref:hypothetical protein n=1 Tax=Clostridium sp. HBUAS56010 TaxID=2571127 RepID=UPI0011786B7F|nr:hypothetical protein [Clostridium sp. HBUAS56010]
MLSDLGEYEHIKEFNPKVKKLDSVHNNLLLKFNAGDKNYNFNCFIHNEAQEYAESGQGATYVVFNEIENSDESIQSEIVSYYTLMSTAIPYEDKVKLDPEEAKSSGKEYDVEICGVSAVEIKMFAVSKKYQDIFYEYEGQSLPIAAWILKDIVNYTNSLITSIVGFQALFLHSVPEAEDFYLKNGFKLIEDSMKPLYCVDYDFKPMYLALRNIPI